MENNIKRANYPIKPSASATNKVNVIKFSPLKCPQQEETLQGTFEPTRHQSENQMVQVPNQNQLLNIQIRVKNTNYNLFQAAETFKSKLEMELERKLPALRRLLTIEERPKRVRSEGMAMALVGTLNWSSN